MKNKEEQQKVSLRAASFQSLSFIAAIAVTIIGVCSLFGWYFNIEYLKSVFPGFPIIAPNSALLLVLLSSAIALTQKAAAKESRIRQVKILLVFPIITIAVLTLIEYVFQLYLGIDSILFLDIAGKTFRPVRMAPQSALNYILISAALLIFMQEGRSKFWERILSMLLALSMFISFVSLFGYLYGLSALYTISSFKGMAAQTSLCFSFLVFAFLAMSPRRNIFRVFISEGLSGYIARRLGISLLIVVIVDIILAIAGRVGLFSQSVEGLLHFILICVAFSWLIWSAFRSVNRIAQMERDIARSKELDRAKSDFVFLASHQLRTPLTTVSWYTEMLLRGDGGMLNDKQNEYLCEIYTGNRRMIDLVDDLLNTSRVDMGTFQIKPEHVNLEEISKSIIKEFMPQIISKRMHFFEQYPENSDLDADPEICRIIIQNLVSNAVKYTPDEGRISIKIKRFEKSFQIEISDTGYGIPKKQQKKIFTKLYRADNVRDKETNGTGLGLYIIKAIVRQIGGSLKLESEEGKGTTFWIEIPIVGRRINVRK